MLQINQMSFSYKYNTPIINNLNLELTSGNITLLVGKNGVGKTTLLKLISGLIFSNSGEIIIDDLNVKKRTLDVLQKVRYVAENPLAYNLPIETYLKLHKNNLQLNVEVIYEYLNKAGINKNTNITSLSTGQLKLFYLLVAGYSSAQIFLLDEPTNGLDIQNQALFYNMLNDIVSSKNKTVLISTHHVTELQNIFDSMLVMNSENLSPLIDLLKLEKNYIINFEHNISGYVENQIYKKIETQKGVVNIYKNENEYGKIDLQALYLSYMENKEVILNLLQEDNNV